MHLLDTRGRGFPVSYSRRWAIENWALIHRALALISPDAMAVRKIVGFKVLPLSLRSSGGLTMRLMEDFGQVDG